MVRIEENKIVIEIPTLNYNSGVDDWQQMTDVLFNLIQMYDSERFSDEERYVAMQLLREMLPRFE
ncbi:MAG: hypothetical protein MR536_02810 [Prevotella sp.]|nr:hypothetical protein [Prevotella sp.]MDY3853115.1 hypothetical protein [Prevotella sp.]